MLNKEGERELEREGGGENKEEKVLLPSKEPTGCTSPSWSRIRLLLPPALISCQSSAPPTLNSNVLQCIVYLWQIFCSTNAKQQCIAYLWQIFCNHSLWAWQSTCKQTRHTKPLWTCGASRTQHKTTVNMWCKQKTTQNHCGHVALAEHNKTTVNMWCLQNTTQNHCQLVALAEHNTKPLSTCGASRTQHKTTVNMWC